MIRPRRIEELFDRLEAGFQSAPADVVDAHDRFVVTVDLPGLREQDVDVSVGPDALTVDATPPPAAGGVEFLRRERRRRAVSRTIPLPEPVDDARATASFEDGVLEVSLPKRRASSSPAGAG